MYSLEVIAVPSFAEEDRAWLQKVRQARAHSLGPPHFTLVFPGSLVEPTVFTGAVTEAVRSIRKITFCLRSAMAVSDPQIGCAHVFLVPDEGFGAILRLHERLHAGELEICLRQGFSYVPHVTVASTPDLAAARRQAAALNSKQIAIAGSISELEIHRREGDVVRCLSKVPLARARLFG